MNKNNRDNPKGNKIAKIDILSLKEVQGNMIIEAEIEIKGIVNKKIFTVPKGSSSTTIKEFIVDTLKKEEKRNENIIGEKFEVEL